MSKKFYIVLIVVLTLLLASCAPAQAPAPAGDTQAPAASQEEAAAEDTPASEPAESTEKVTLTIESWRNDDLKIWEDTIIPAFNAKFPNIEVIFAPTAPA